MDRLGFHPGRFGHPLGGAASWSAKQHPDALDPENAQDRIDDGRLADAGLAGDDKRLARQSESDRGALAVGEFEAAALLDPRDGFGRLDWRPGKLAAGDPGQPIGDGLFGAVEAGEKRAVSLADL